MKVQFKFSVFSLWLLPSLLSLALTTWVLRSIERRDWEWFDEESTKRTRINGTRNSRRSGSSTRIHSLCFGRTVSPPPDRWHYLHYQLSIDKQLSLLGVAGSVSKLICYDCSVSHIRRQALSLSPSVVERSISLSKVIFFSLLLLFLLLIDTTTNDCTQQQMSDDHGDWRAQQQQQ